MRILHVLNELRPSGAEVMLRTSAPLWRERGVESEILATGHQVGSFAPELRAAGVAVHHLPFAKSVGYVHAVRRLVSAGNYAVLHIHTERASFYYGLAGLSVPGTAVVRTIHNVFAFRGALRARRRLQRTLLRVLGLRSISVGATVEANERERFGIPTTRIPNWVDTRRFVPPSDADRSSAREHLGVEDDDVLVIISVGNCNRAKNHGAVLRALSGWSEEIDWLYLHVGEESSDGAERRLATELGIAERCRFLGFVPDVVTLLHASDVYVMPSLHEGVGNAALEALATGLTCVLATSPGLEDLRDTMDRGIVWVAPTPVGVRQGLTEVVGRPGSVSADARTARHQTVARHHGARPGAERYLDVYRQATAR